MTHRFLVSVICSLSVLLVAEIPAADVAHGPMKFGNPSKQEFQKYWYHQGAEITNYELEQARYGHMHPGSAVLIFVTEPFNPKLQVKADDPNAGNPKPVPILKLNSVRKFNTGIYRYSGMTSIFSPTDTRTHPLPMKITHSLQEWCGHVFQQLNLRDDGYHLRSYSYFESEGDKEMTLPRAMPEDGLWVLMRLSPGSLPQGEIELIPGTLISRLRHFSLAPQKVKARLVAEDLAGKSSDKWVTYSLQFASPERTLAVQFGKDFPHAIEAWQETHVSGFGKSAKRLTTKAKRKKRLFSFYWDKHNPQDQPLREKLGLEF